MKQNDMRSVVYLILALICFYYLLDDFIGKKKVTNWVGGFIGNFGGPAVTDTQTQTDTSQARAQTQTQEQTQTSKAKAKQTAKATDKAIQPNLDPSKNPDAQVSKPTPKWNPFPNLTFPSIFAGIPALAGDIGAAVGELGGALAIP